MKLKVGDCLKNEEWIIKILEISNKFGDGPWYYFKNAINYGKHNYSGSLRIEHLKEYGYKYCKSSTVLYGGKK